MERDNLTQSNTNTYFINSISKNRGIRLAAHLIHKLTSIVLMLIFTVFGFVIFVISVVLLTAESLISRVLLPKKASQKEKFQDLVEGENSSSYQVSQTK